MAGREEEEEKAMGMSMADCVDRTLARLFVEPDKSLLRRRRLLEARGGGCREKEGGVECCVCVCVCV